MLPFTSTPPYPSGKEKRRYAPLTPSPLNPNNTPSTYLSTIQQHWPRTSAPLPNNGNNNSNNRRPSVLKPSSPANRTQQRYAQLASESPTQRLLRQKAAAAWRRAEILRLQHELHHEQQQHPQQLISSGFRSDLRQPRPHAHPRHNPHARGTATAMNRDSHHPAGAVLVSFDFDAVSDSRGRSSGSRDRGRGNGREVDKGPSSGGADGNGDNWGADLTLTIPLTLTESEDGGADEEEGQESDDEGDIGLLMGGKRADSSCSTKYASGSGFSSGPGSRSGRVLMYCRGHGNGEWDTEPARGGIGEGGFDVERGAGRDLVWGEDGVGAGWGDKRRRASGGAGLTLRRMLVVVAVIVGLGLVHGVVSAFGSGHGS